MVSCSPKVEQHPRLRCNGMGFEENAHSVRTKVVRDLHQTRVALSAARAGTGSGIGSTVEGVPSRKNRLIMFIVVPEKRVRT
jgi:ribosomal protein S5